jgi:hypothetical protein
VRTTVTTAKDVGVDVGQAIRSGPGRTMSSRTRSRVEPSAAATAAVSPDGSRQKRARGRKAQSAAA